MSKRFILELFCDSKKMGTFGELSVNAEHIAYSVGQPWNDNKPFDSCVPAGDYQLVAYSGTKYKDTFALENLDLGVGVHKGDALRYACVIHSANKASELMGCTAFGDNLGMLDGEWAIYNSAETTAAVIDMMEEGDILTIIWKDHP